MKNIPKYVITIDKNRHDAFKNRIPWPTIKYKGVKNKKNGCGLSHLNLWKEAGRKHAFFLVFEDDAELCRDFTQQHEKAIQSFLHDPDSHILFLGYNPYFTYSTGYKSPNIMNGHGLDLHAYIIKTPYAKYLDQKYGKMIRTNTFKFLGAIDTLFFLEPINILTPILFIQNGDSRYNHVENFVENKPKLLTRLCTFANYVFFYGRMELFYIVIVLMVIIITATLVL
jgi:GR25 family glycosyltransferase involved in LPS biosynthesis